MPAKCTAAGARLALAAVSTETETTHRHTCPLLREWTSWSDRGPLNGRAWPADKSARRRTESAAPAGSRRRRPSQTRRRRSRRTTGTAPPLRMPRAGPELCAPINNTEADGRGSRLPLSKSPYNNNNTHMHLTALCPGLSSWASTTKVQEAPLSLSDRAMRLVSSNLANYHATVQKLLTRQVLTKSMVWSWRFSQRQCVIYNVHSTMTRPSRLPLSHVS